jgi:hypothetical protein
MKAFRHPLVVSIVQPNMGRQHPTRSRQRLLWADSLSVRFWPIVLVEVSTRKAVIGAGGERKGCTKRTDVATPSPLAKETSPLHTFHSHPLACSGSSLIRGSPPLAIPARELAARGTNENGGCLAWSGSS